MVDVAFVRTEMVPAQEPPGSAIGPIRWARAVVEAPRALDVLAPIGERPGRQCRSKYTFAIRRSCS